MATIVEHEVAPTPKAYDLLGLTEDEFDAICALVGGCTDRIGTYDPYTLYSKLCGVRDMCRQTIRKSRQNATSPFRLERGKP